MSRRGGAGGGRSLAGACVGLVAAAGLLWGASAASWTPPVAAEANAGAPSALTGVAFLALAGVAALVATSGAARRIVGGLLGVVGGVVVVATVVAVAARSVAVGVGPLLAVGGGLVLAAVGCAVLVREPRLRRLGARYAAAGSPAAHADPDRAAWAALDEGHDPTADPPAGRLVDQATAPGGDGSAESDDPGGGRGGSPV